MILNSESSLTKLFHESISARIFPGAAMAVISSTPPSQEIFFGFHGYTDYQRSRPVSMDTVYDLASLTKPLATTLALYSLIQHKKIKLEEHLASLLECPVPMDKQGITLAHLLNHSAGFEPHQPFFEQLIGLPVEKRFPWLLHAILTAPLAYKTGNQQIYSDIGFMLLGMIVEKKSGVFLDDYVRETIFKPLGIEKHLFFRGERNKSGDQVFAPTEDCPWRKRVLCGEVHDDNTSALGGVAGHAGLFGTMQGVAGIVGFLLDCVRDRHRKQHSFFNPEHIKKAVRRQTTIGTWGLGFDTRSINGSSSGRYLSGSSFGHLGYTGTSFWVDPERDLAFILLSNRVHPCRSNEKIKIFRPLFHDTVMEWLLNRAREPMIRQSSQLLHT